MPKPLESPGFTHGGAVNDLSVLAHQLEQTALNKGFHGSALYEAKSLPGMTYDDKIVLSRWLRGVQRRADNIALQDIAIKIRKMEAK